MPGLRHSLARCGGILRKVTCPDCGQVILLTEQHRGKTVICPGCHSLLGCLVGPDRRRAGRASAGKSGGRTTIFELMTFISAVALGLAAMLALWEESDAGLVVQGTSVLALPICWALTVLRMLAPRMRRGRRFSPPGVAACLAVSVGSLLNLFTSWDTIILYVGPRSLLLVAMLRAVTPLPLAVGRGGSLAAPPLRRPVEAGAELDRPGRPLPRCLLAPVRAGSAVRALFPGVTCRNRSLRYQGSPRRPSRPRPGQGSCGDGSRP